MALGCGTGSLDGACRHDDGWVVPSAAIFVPCRPVPGWPAIDKGRRRMQTAIATVSLSGTLNEKLEAIAAAKFTGVEIFENDLLSFNGTPLVQRNTARGAPDHRGSRPIYDHLPAIPRFLRECR